MSKKAKFGKLLIALFGCVFFTVTGYYVRVVKQAVEHNFFLGSPLDVMFDEFGRVKLYGGLFYFDCGDGEISWISDASGRTVAPPPGSVLVAVRSHYTIGYYEGDDITIQEDGKSWAVPKIFFTLYKNGKIEYSLPDATNPRFGSGEITGKVIFYQRHNQQSE